MTTPKITTFVASKAQVSMALENGADHLIFEDSKLSIRSFSDDFYTEDFNKLIAMAKLAREMNPYVEISFNLDVVYHERYKTLVISCLNTLKEAEISQVRLQDPGLRSLVLNHSPHLDIHLNTETANANLESATYYANLFQSQTINNELPVADINVLKHKIQPESLEIFVQGPLLIQYSNRRFIAGLNKAEESNAIYIREAQDDQYPNRFYKFYDNRHGHFMYLYFHRCLIEQIQILKSLNLGQWLVDARGESNNYFTTALSLYKKLSKLDSFDEAELQNDFKAMQICSPKPLKLGFFKVNLTDKSRSKQDLLAESLSQNPQYKEIGIVKDVVKGKRITFECFLPIKIGSELLILSPEGRHIVHHVANLWNIENEAVEVFNGGIAQLSWFKGVLPESIIYLNLTVSS